MKNRTYNKVEILFIDIIDNLIHRENVEDVNILMETVDYFRNTWKKYCDDYTKGLVKPSEEKMRERELCEIGEELIMDLLKNKYILWNNKPLTSCSMWCEFQKTLKDDDILLICDRVATFFDDYRKTMCNGFDRYFNKHIFKFFNNQRNNKSKNKFYKVR